MSITNQATFNDIFRLSYFSHRLALGVGTRYHTGMEKSGVESGYKKEYFDRLSRKDRSIKIALFVIPCALLLIMTIGMFLPIFGIKDGPKDDTVENISLFKAHAFYFSHAALSINTLAIASGLIYLILPSTPEYRFAKITYFTLLSLAISVSVASYCLDWMNFALEK